MATNTTTVKDLRNSDDIGKLVLRVLLGVLTLLHGIAKISAGPGFVLSVISKAGLPPALAYGVYIGEVLAPILIIVGLWTRPAAIVVAINMIVALALVHSGQFLQLGPQGGHALELQFFFLFVAVAIALFGAGRYSVGGTAGRWN